MVPGRNRTLTTLVGEDLVKTSLELKIRSRPVRQVWYFDLKAKQFAALYVFHGHSYLK